MRLPPFLKKSMYKGKSKSVLLIMFHKAVFCCSKTKMNFRLIFHMVSFLLSVFEFAFIKHVFYGNA